MSVSNPTAVDTAKAREIWAVLRANRLRTFLKGILPQRVQTRLRARETRIAESGFTVMDRLPEENVRRFYGEAPNWTVRLADAFAGFAESNVDRVIVDLAEPWRLLGESQLQAGEVEQARRSFLRGIAKDRGDWEVWLDLALATRGGERRDALDHDAFLNPLSSELRDLRGSS